MTQVIWYWAACQCWLCVWEVKFSTDVSPFPPGLKVSNPCPSHPWLQQSSSWRSASTSSELLSFRLSAWPTQITSNKPNTAVVPLHLCTNRGGAASQGANPTPSSTRIAKAGKNHLNEEITPLLPTGIDEWYSQNTNIGHAALLRQCWLPL